MSQSLQQKRQQHNLKLLVWPMEVICRCAIVVSHGRCAETVELGLRHIEGTITGFRRTNRGACSSIITAQILKTTNDFALTALRHSQVTKQLLTIVDQTLSRRRGLMCLLVAEIEVYANARRST